MHRGMKSILEASSFGICAHLCLWRMCMSSSVCACLFTTTCFGESVYAVKLVFLLKACTCMHLVKWFACVAVSEALTCSLLVQS